MTSELNCTQFTEPYPEPGTDKAANTAVPVFITAIVEAYRPFHTFLLLFLLIFAFVANILIVIVLWQKEMRKVGVNVTMMLIALCDFGCSVAALGQMLLRSYTDDYPSYLSAYSQVIFDYLAVAFHASSLYLAAGMAFCRVMSLNLSNKNRSLWQSPSYAVRVALFLASPVFILSSVVLFVNTVQEDEEGVYIDISELSLRNNCMFLKTSLVMAGSCFKLFPCIGMLSLSIFLLGRINDGKRSMVASISSNQKDKTTQIDRSSRFIQFVLVVFLVTESPQGVFSIVGGLCIIDYINYYQNLTIFMNVLAFFNTTTSFIIYSTLSSKFRKLFAQLFLPDSIMKRMYQKRSTVMVHTATLN